MSVIRAYLGQLRYIDQDIDSRFKELSYLRASIPSSANYQLDKVMASRSTEDHKINKILLLDEYISQQTDRLIDLKAKINKEIDELPESEHRAVLRYRYCQRMKWAEIGELMGCSAKTARRIEQAALESFGVVNHQSIEKFTTP